MGEKNFVAESEESIQRVINAQVCGVNKALLSVKKVAKTGQQVVFDEDGSCIEDKKTGEKTWFNRKDNVYVLYAMVRHDNQGFRRQS